VSDTPNPNGPPTEITHLIRQRTEARDRKDWARADSLKAEIEALGWKVTDHRGKTSVSRAAPPSVEIGGELRYGSAAAVPSLLDSPADSPWTAVLLAGEAPERLSAVLAGLRTSAPAGTQVVIVANDPSDAQQAALADGSPDRAAIGGREIEVLRTATRLGRAAALNIGLRRAAGEFVLLADGSAAPTGDALTPLARELQDPAVAVAGGFGLTSAEPGRLRPASLEPSDVPETGALMAGWMAFRRVDLIALGPLDEQFVTPAWLDVWWSLRLRAGADPDWTDDAGDESGEEEAQAIGPDAEPVTAPEFELPAPRRAVCLNLPLERFEVPWPPDRSRLGRRNMYRVLRRFGWREDLF
jgi:hypothetical protein